MEHKMLVSQMPTRWQGMFVLLDGRERPWRRIEDWYEETQHSQYGFKLSWQELLNSLIQEEPAIQQDTKKLEFIPRFVQLPCVYQRHLLAFIQTYMEDISLDTLSNFVNKLCQQNIPDLWVKKLLENLTEDIEQTKIARKGLTDDDSVLDNSLPTPMDVDTPTKLSFSQASGQFIGLSQCDVSRLDSTIVLSQVSQSDDSEQTLEEKLGPDLWGKAYYLKENLHGPDLQEDFKLDVAIISDCSPKQLEAVCTMLEPDAISENNMLTFVTCLMTMTPEISYSNCVTFSSVCILPRICNLTQNASRVLSSLVTGLVNKFPKQTIEGVLVPYMKQDSPIGAPQTDLLCRLVKDTLKAENKQAFLKEILKVRSEWCESTITLLQTFIETKTDLDEVLLTALTSGVESNSMQHVDNLKFTKLILALLNKHGKQMQVGDLSNICGALECNKTFLKKSAMAALKRIQR